MGDSGAPGSPAADPRTRELDRRLAAVTDRLEAAVVAAGRDPGSVELLVVTKFFPAEDVRRLIELGARAFGESREPEAGRKVAAVREGIGDPRADVVFDMIGTVQSKKANSVARWARAVHSVDRAKVADQLARGAASALDTGDRQAPLEVLIQVSLDGDPHRGGVVEAELDALAERVATAPALLLKGLMAITPQTGAAEAWMAETARIHADFVDRHPTATTLSAGMSGDLEVAVAHGSTCVRVGTAIMGERPLVSQ